MRHLWYAMQFIGRATSDSPDDLVLKAATAAVSSTIASAVGPDGIESAFTRIVGGEATFTSEVTFTGKTSFQESGAIVFGEEHWFRFSTVGSGYITVSPHPGIRHGAVIWQVDGGEGQFSGARGLITSNFLIDDVLTITDHQCGVIVLP